MCDRLCASEGARGAAGGGLGPAAGGAPVRIGRPTPGRLSVAGRRTERDALSVAVPGSARGSGRGSYGLKAKPPTAL